METSLKVETRTNPLPQIIAAVVVAGTFGTVVGYLTARIFTQLNPITGALFGGAAVLGAGVVLPFLNFFGNSEVEKVAKFILHFLASIAIAFAVVVMMGHTITFQTSIFLGLLIIPMSYVTAYITSIFYSCLKNR